MCFSAEASFAVGAVLVPAGASCIRTAVRGNRAYLPLALVPAIFAIQQFCEGLVWVGLDHDQPALVKIGSLGFLFFALAFWLVWIPFCVLFIETRRSIRLAVGVVMAVGLVYGALLFVPMALDPEARLHIRVDYHSIQYECQLLDGLRDLPKAVRQGLYIAIAFFPMLVSVQRHFVVFGISLAIAAVITHIFYWYAFISVWCFFAAILSAQLCYILHRQLDPAVVPVPSREQM